MIMDEQQISDFCFQNPWSAAILKVIDEIHHEILCQGSLITDSLILTAAHCFHDENDIPKLYVVLGSDEPLKLNFKEGKKRNVEYIHEIGE